jgi:thiol-disulfide isomerase/thioredoxin
VKFLNSRFVALAVVLACGGMRSFAVEQPGQEKEPKPGPAAPDAAKVPTADSLALLLKQDSKMLIAFVIVRGTNDMDALGLTQDSKVLVAFVQKLETLEPKDQAEAQSLAVKAPAAIKLACERILEIEKGDATEPGHFARRYMLAFDLRDAKDPLSPAAQKVYDAIAKLLDSPTTSLEDGQFATEVVGEFVEPADEKKAIALFGQYAKLLSKSNTPGLVAAAKQMEGSARRLDLPGKPLELKGTLLDGKAFDISSLKGKVVLVDFWATWCGYCVEEIPNILKNYDGYHKKGFEVVGGSADAHPAELDKFVAERKLPWLTLHDKAGRNDALEYYGITGFPTTFLIDRDGKVVATEARGEQLPALLKKLLGEPEAPPAAPVPAEKK